MFKVGQKVRIISLDHLDKVAVRAYNHGFEWHNPTSMAIMYDFMALRCGETVTIEAVEDWDFDLKYTMKEIDWIWADWMLEAID